MKKMAEAMSSKQDLFMCSICLDLLKDPVTLHCGHNYCSGCINSCWDQEDQKGVYSCPQCRQTFTSRPVLKRNNVMAELVEEMRKTTIQPDAPADHGDVQCDVCFEKKLKAVKSCLDCLMSYCETHFKAHNDLNRGRNHSIVDATGQLQERICPHHNKVLEIFCLTDQSCVCYLCTMDQHKGHDTIAAAAECSNKKQSFLKMKTRCQETIQKREKEVQELRRAVDTLKSSAQSAVEHSDQMFDDIIRSVERRRSEVTELIRAQEKAELSRAEGLWKQLKQKISELKKRVAEMEQLSHTQDHIHFLKNVGSISDIPDSTIPTSLNVNSILSFESVKTSVSSLKTQLEEKLDSIFKQEAVKISAAVSGVRVVSTEPVTREDFLQYYCNFTLDPNTANRYLHLSEGNRRVKRMEKTLQSYPDHTDRFDDKWCQVLCREGVSGRCYWEVEWSGEWVNIAVAYKTINRKGSNDACWFGDNNQSWRLTVDPRKTHVKHNKNRTDLPLVASSRVGVYVDHRAGTLAFYSISDNRMTLLHKVQTTFSHTLYPGFAFADGSSAKLFESDNDEMMAEELEQLVELVCWLRSDNDRLTQEATNRPVVADPAATPEISNAASEPSNGRSVCTAQGTERYVMIAHAVWYRHIHKRKISVIVSVIIWILSAVITFFTPEEYSSGGAGGFVDGLREQLEEQEKDKPHIMYLKDKSNMNQFPEMDENISELKMDQEEKVDSICKQEADTVSAAVSEEQAVMAEGVTREDFLQYYCRFTLDPNTAHRYLHLSEENRRAERRDEDPQSYPDHPERFDEKCQVLCREGVSGRCYWEVEWSGETWVNVAVSYKTLIRKGNIKDSWFGGNEQSWKLYVGGAHNSGVTAFAHNNMSCSVGEGSSGVGVSRVGVYVDHRAGTLAFYSISDTTMTLLHKVQTTFSHTLYPGFRLGARSSVKLL
ncbi:E3 ubiquitin-protein ligase TRIM16-like [Engraulis encrasicolus]|uniref:E3 ubiquitin-protein ligase TRIM16-like n=1 Tax=Engraulis encrasicolus TaxID=184585 RepID=UPI002FD72674